MLNDVKAEDIWYLLDFIGIHVLLKCDVWVLLIVAV